MPKGIKEAKMAAKKKVVKRRKKLDPKKEMLVFLSKASLNLGAAAHKAYKVENFDLADEIRELARMSERLEMRITGKPIDRSGK